MIWRQPCEPVWCAGAQASQSWSSRAGRGYRVGTRLLLKPEHMVVLALVLGGGWGLLFMKGQSLASSHLMFECHLLGWLSLL